jgi:hypothetical protein
MPPKGGFFVYLYSNGRTKLSFIISLHKDKLAESTAFRANLESTLYMVYLHL